MSTAEPLRTASEITHLPQVDFRDYPGIFQPSPIELDSGDSLAFTSSFHWYEEADGSHSGKVYAEATFTGDEEIVQVPRVKFQPDRHLVPVTLPVVEISANWPKVPARHVGRAAVAYLFEGQSPGIFGLDVEALNRVLGVESDALRSHLGLIRDGSLHSIQRSL